MSVILRTTFTFLFAFMFNGQVFASPPIFAANGTISEGVDGNFLKYDSVEQTITANKNLFEATCGRKSDFDFVAKKLADTMESLNNDLERPFDVLESVPDKKAYESFQKLKIEVMASKPNINKLIKAMTSFEDDFNRLHPNQNITVMQHWLSKIFAKYGSKEVIILTQTHMEIFFGIYLNPYVYLMDEDVLSASTLQTSGYVDLAEYRLRELNNYFQSTEEPEQISAFIEKDLNELALTKSTLRNFPDTIDNNLMQNKILQMESYLKQIVKLSRNPRAEICGQGQDTESQSQLMDWCIHNDSGFVEFLANISSQANDIAADMRINKASSIVRGFVGSGGQFCQIKGFYHLLKKDNNEVMLSTSGKLEVARNNNVKKTKFEAFDLLTALAEKPNFTLEK
jgi:hypothetical protein